MRALVLAGLLAVIALATGSHAVIQVGDQFCAPGGRCEVAQRGCGYCICTGRTANDFGITSYSLLVQGSGSPSVITGYYGAIDEKLYSTGQAEAILRMTMYIDGQDTAAIAIGLHSIANVTLPSGPGPIAFVYNDNGYFFDQGVFLDQEVFFQSEFFDSNGVRLNCIRTDIYDWPAIGPYPPTPP